MNDGEAMVKTRKMTCRDTATVRPIALRIIGSLITIVLLLWTIRSGYEIATETRRHTDLGYSQWAFHVGVVTVFFGFLFMALGIPILLDLFLKLSEQLQKHHEEEHGIHQAREMIICIRTARIFVNVATMLVLIWAIYTGFILSMEPGRDGKCHFLTFSIGLVTIVFGCVYFIIGLAIILELTLDLGIQLQNKEKKGTNIQKCDNMHVKCFV